MKNLITLSFITLFIRVNPLAAQEYYFRHYQVENGLSNNTVFCSLQDKKGFLWFGTKEGLNRFDGYTFKVFYNSSEGIPGLPFNFIYQLCEDNNNNLWVGTDKGLYRYDEKTEKLTIVGNQIADVVAGIQMDKDGAIWFISDKKIFRYQEKTKPFLTYKKSMFEATSICSTADGDLWFSSSNGSIYRYNASTGSFAGFNVFNKSKPSTTNRIEKIFSTGDSSLLIGTSSQGAKIFNIRTGIYKDIITHYSNNTEILAHDFVKASPDVYWIATDFGIFVYNIKTEKITNIRKDYNDPYSISDDAVHTLCKDKEGGIWAGTYFGGLNYYPKQYTSFKKYFPKAGENSISGNIAREIVQDRSGNFWIGTEDAGLNKLDGNTGVFTHFLPTPKKRNISFSTVFGLLPVDDKLWIGTYQHGLDVFDIKTGTVIKHYAAGNGPNSLKSNLIETIYLTRQGDILIGTLLGLYKYNKKNDHFSIITEVPSTAYVYTIEEDDDGTIWVGTKGKGLYYYNVKTGEKGCFRYETNNHRSLGSDLVNDIYINADHNVWIATKGGGLCRFNRASKDFKRFTIGTGNSVFKILEDDKKIFWVSTSKGLVSFNPATERQVVYTKADGLLSEQFSNSSGFKDRTGRMYFGSVKGLISFNPGDFVKNTYNPPVYITGFQVYNKELIIHPANSPLQSSLSFTDKIKLGYNQASFSIDFSALSYTSPEKTEYAYKMEGLDKDWTFLSTKRKAYFTELSPGLYTFKVKASTPGGVWNSHETKLVIEIIPPIWARWWTYLMYVFVATIIIAYFLISYRQKQKDKNKRSLELLKHEQEKEIYQAKFDFFTIIAHEIRTPLTLIKGPMELVLEKAHKLPEIKNYLVMMDRNINRLVDLTNQLLDFRKVETKGFSLNFSRENISDILEEVYTRFELVAHQKKLCYKIDIQEKDLYAFIDLDAINKILGNLVNNAIKYAESRVEIALLRCSKIDKEYCIKIKNDGYLIPWEMKENIFETFYRLKETEKYEGTGIGLALARTLTELHKGTLQLKEPENNMNVFELKLPLNQQDY